MGLEKIKYQGTESYAILFDESEEIPFEIPPDHTNGGVVIIPITGVTKLYVFHEIKRSGVICLLSSGFFFFVTKL